MWLHDVIIIQRKRRQTRKGGSLTASKTAHPNGVAKVTEHAPLGQPDNGMAESKLGMLAAVLDTFAPGHTALMQTPPHSEGEPAPSIALARPGGHIIWVEDVEANGV